MQKEFNQQIELLNICWWFSDCTCEAFWVVYYCTFDRKLHGAVQVTQVPVAALHNLVSGRWGLAGHRALLVDLEAAFLVQQQAGADCQRREALLAHAAIPCCTCAALTHTLVLLFDQGLHFLLCK